MKKLKRSKTSLISAVVFAAVLVLFGFQPAQAVTEEKDLTYYSPRGIHTIPDGTYDENHNLEFLTSPVEVTENYTITHLGVEVNITHPYDDDLTISLISPTGREFVLARHNGEKGDNFTNTMFEDSADYSITEGTAPFTGSYRPVDSLTDLNGTNMAGLWTLKVLDDDNGGEVSDKGTLNYFGLYFTYADVDEDQDGYTITSDCNDNDASINPGVSDNTQDGVDNNCDGYVDEGYVAVVPDVDGDGYDAEHDCNDNNASINPGITEDQEGNIHDGVDNNCNGVTDENYVTPLPEVVLPEDDTTTTTPPADTNTDTNTNTDEVDVTTEDQTPETSDTDTQITEVTVVKVSPTKKGYKITYSDGSVKTVVVFKGKSKKKTQVKYYPEKDLVLVLQGNGKKIALWNVLTSEKLSQVKLSQKAYNTNSFKIKKINDKKTVIIKSLNKKKQESQKSLIRLLLKQQNLKTVSTILGE